mgnify:CR=1 FL=1
MAELARREAIAVKRMNVDKVGKAKAGKPPRALHADRPADASLESLHSLSKVVGTHKAPFALGRTGRTAGYQDVHVVIHLAETADSQTENIEALPIWIPPSRSITWEMVGSQFTMTLCTGFSQTPENDNGRCAHSRFSGFAKIPCTGSW